MLNCLIDVFTSSLISISAFGTPHVRSKCTLKHTSPAVMWCNKYQHGWLREYCLHYANWHLVNFGRESNFCSCSYEKYEWTRNVFFLFTISLSKCRRKKRLLELFANSREQIFFIKSWFQFIEYIYIQGTISMKKMKGIRGWKKAICQEVSEQL